MVRNWVIASTCFCLSTVLATLLMYLHCFLSVCLCRFHSNRPDGKHRDALMLSRQPFSRHFSFFEIGLSLFLDVLLFTSIPCLFHACISVQSIYLCLQYGVTPGKMEPIKQKFNVYMYPAVCYEDLLG